jgi:hypothetical protein
LLSNPKVFVALIVQLYTPAAVGVPEITPVVGSKLAKPGAGGMGVTPKVMGVLPVAVIVYINGTPTNPVAVRGLVMTGAFGLAAREVAATANTRASGMILFIESS